MVYNEAVLLPIWARHYALQVGADHCYVVDHGSTDFIVVPPGMNTVRLPRSPHDDKRRAAFISQLTKGLLNYYDWVLYTDVDELVIADPHRFRDLPTFCASASLDMTFSAVGLDVQHLPAEEPPLDPRHAVGEQRGWVRFTSAMCKPVLTSQALNWSPGFHWCDRPVVFTQLYLFHLHWADQTIGLSRLHKTRRMAWSGEEFGEHQRMTDAAWLELFRGMAAMPKAVEARLDLDLSPAADWLALTKQGMKSCADGMFDFDLGINAGELWPIPAHFRARL